MPKGKNKDVEAQTENPPRREEESFIIKKYNEVVQSAELLDIRLTSSSFYIKPEYFAQRRLQNESGNHDTGFKLGGSLEWAEYDMEDGILIGQIDWRASFGRKRRKLLSVTASYVAVYDVAKTLDERYTRAFLKNVGQFATFPYFRSLVSQYSAASSADLPILPVLKQRLSESPSDDESR